LSEYASLLAAALSTAAEAKLCKRVAVVKSFLNITHCDVCICNYPNLMDTNDILELSLVECQPVKHGG